MPAVLSKQYSLIDKINMDVRDTVRNTQKCCTGIAIDKSILEYLYRKARDHPEMLFDEFVKSVIDNHTLRTTYGWAQCVS